MFNLFELSYGVQKDMFFTDVISTDAYNIYYNDKIDSQHCNFAVFSDVMPVKDFYDEVDAHFSRLKRPMVVYVDSDTSSEMRSLVERKFKITYSGFWLRYEGEKISLPEQPLAKVVQVENDAELEDFLKVFSDSYSKRLSHYGIDDVGAYVEAIKKNYKKSKYRSFVAYDDKKPVATATIGVENGFCLIFNQTTVDGYLGTHFTEAIRHECMRFYKEVGGKSLCTRIVNNQNIERWYLGCGFRRIKSVYRLTHDVAYSLSISRK